MLNDEADQKKGQHAHSERIGGERIEPKAAERCQQSQRGNAAGEAGIDHETGEKINLGAEQAAQRSEGSLKKHQHEGCGQHQDIMQDVHGSFTQTSSRALTLTWILTRASL